MSLVLVLYTQKKIVFFFLKVCRVYELMMLIKSSVVRQKRKSKNGCFKKTKHAKFSEKQTFVTPWYAHVRFL